MYSPCLSTTSWTHDSVHSRPKYSANKEIKTIIFRAVKRSAILKLFTSFVYVNNIDFFYQIKSNLLVDIKI